MKRKILYAVLVVAVIAFGVRTYLAFHPSRGFVSRSPAGGYVVDCVPSGFIDLSYRLRAHNLQASPFQPLVIADLFWEQRYFCGSLFWSRDGSVAAASIISYSDRSEALACAYDFREHRVIRSGSLGSPLNAASDTQIRSLLQSRGGYTQHSLPEPKEM